MFFIEGDARENVLRFFQKYRAPRDLAYRETSFVADNRRVDMFESGGIFYHAVAVHAAFVHECGFADVGRVLGRRTFVISAMRRAVSVNFLMESSGRISYSF